MKKVFALLVGITDYQDSIALDNGTVYFPKLSGCVNDALKLKTFLCDRFENASIKELYNSTATKSEICESFLTHFKSAQKGDSIFFYFSGHGTQEIADPSFKTETDGKLESMVCYYDAKSTENFLIADKELRYLISQVATEDVPVTLILDCCHSGDVTRAALLKTNFTEPVQKQSKGSYTFSRRQWKEFIFQERFSSNELAEKGIHELMPEGNHIVFSASESNEPAYELGGEGVFTKNLMDTLTLTGGLLSNHQLFDRVAMRMKCGYVQKPRLYMPARYNSLRTEGFLKLNSESTESTALVIFNKKAGWILNQGALHGLNQGLRTLNLVGALDKTRTITATIETVKLDHTILKLPEGTDHNHTFLANTAYLSKNVVRIYLALESAIPKDVLVMITEIDSLPQYEVEMVGDESNADFVLQHLQGVFYLTLPENTYRPISEGVMFLNRQEIIDQLKHLSRWKFVHNLSFQDGVGIDEVLRVEYALGADPYASLGRNGETRQIVVEKWEHLPGQYAVGLKMKLTNMTPNELYVAVLYLDVNYSVSTLLLEPSPYFLEAGNSIELSIEGNPLRIEFYNQALFFNYKQYTERIKIIVSRYPFDVYSLKLEPLVEPSLPGMETLRSLKMGAKGIRSEQRREFEEWLVASLDIISVNPQFNQISAHDLKKMLEDKVTSSFAEGLYFTTSEAMTEPDKSNADLQLKPEIEILAPGMRDGKLDNEKGVVVDVANWWARRRRNHYYDEIIRRFPERIRIVSEGDSWFQHPLVYDTIDHLSKIYAIRCVAAAADTLSNYFSGEIKHGDYFLDVIRTVRPAFFIISGGGNDILGSQFRSFLVDKPYGNGLQGSTDGGKFLKESFDIELDKLMSIYRVVFELLASEFSDMKTIVHGYDYPVHLDSAKKGWLGRYMIEKGISEPGDRRVVIKYIMNRFNTRLGELAGQYSETVRYLDLRNTVHYKPNEIDQWYDEIHPNSDGFQLIALKFIELIENLKRGGEHTI